MTAAFRNPHNLPTKVCVVCNRPFTWRKKWESSWDEITTCSKRCNNERKKSNRIARGAERAEEENESDVQRNQIIAVTAQPDAVELPEPQLTVSDKVAVVASELNVDVSALPLIQAVAACNEKLGLDMQGKTVAQQVEALMGALQLREDGDASLKDEQADEDEAGEAIIDPKAARKAAKKAQKAQRRARREGQDSGGQKACDVCDRSVDVLIRCTMDSTKEWKMVCGRCWKTPEVAGGVVDGDGQNSHYRYGGLWKNLHRAS